MWEYLVFLGAAAGFWGMLVYVRDTLRGTTKPNRVTWLIWAVNPLIAAFVSFADGVGLAAIPVLFTGLGPLLVLLASFVNKNSYWQLNRFNYFCGICSIVALVFWATSSGPVLPIAMAIISDTFAVVPTLIKMWDYPETETAAAYLLGFFCALTSFAAIKVWDFSSYAFPLYLVIANIFLIFAVYRKKIFKVSPAPR